MVQPAGILPGDEINIAKSPRNVDISNGLAIETQDPDLGIAAVGNIDLTCRCIHTVQC